MLQDYADKVTRKLLRGSTYVALTRGDSSLIGDVQRDKNPGGHLREITRKAFNDIGVDHVIIDSGTRVPDKFRYKSLGFGDELASPTLTFYADE